MMDGFRFQNPLSGVLLLRYNLIMGACGVHLLLSGTQYYDSGG